MVQHRDSVGFRHLVDKVGCPQHADAFFGNQAAHIGDDIGARPDVEADSWLIEQQQARSVQKRASDLHPSHLTARQLANLFVNPIGKLDSCEQILGALECTSSPDAVQRRMIGEVLHHRQIEVERAQLEHHAKPAQGGPGCPRYVVTKDTNLPVLRREEPRDQGEKRALPRTVEPEQDDKGRRRNREAHIGKGLAGSIGMANAIDRQGRWGGQPRQCLGVMLYRDHHGAAMKTPQGCSPTLSVLPFSFGT